MHECFRTIKQRYGHRSIIVTILLLSGSLLCTGSGVAWTCNTRPTATSHNGHCARDGLAPAAQVSSSIALPWQPPVLDSGVAPPRGWGFLCCPTVAPGAPLAGASECPAPPTASCGGCVGGGGGVDTACLRTHGGGGIWVLSRGGGGSLGCIPSSLRVLLWRPRPPWPPASNFWSSFMPALSFRSSTVSSISSAIALLLSLLRCSLHAARLRRPVTRGGGRQCRRGGGGSYAGGAGRTTALLAIDSACVARLVPGASLDVNSQPCMAPTAARFAVGPSLRVPGRDMDRFPLAGGQDPGTSCPVWAVALHTETPRFRS